MFNLPRSCPFYSLVFFFALQTPPSSLLAANDSLTWFRFPLSRDCSSQRPLTLYNQVSGRVEKWAVAGSQTEKSSSCRDFATFLCFFLSHFCRPYFPNNRKYISSSSKFSTSLCKVCQLLVFYSTVCALVSSARMIFWLRMIGTLYIYIYKWRLAWRIRNAIDYSYATGHSSKGIALLHYCNCLQISNPHFN